MLKELCLETDKRKQQERIPSSAPLTCKTLPTTTLSIVSGGTLPADKAALAANSAKSVLVKSFRSPPYAPKGVRLAATINTPIAVRRLVSNYRLVSDS